MTIEEFTKNVEIAPLLLITFVCTVILVMWTHNFKKRKLEDAKANIYGTNILGIPTTEYNVTLIDKTISQHTVHADWTIPVKYCVFQLTGGEKIRLAIEDEERYALMSIGDIGTLKYSGKRFIDYHIGVANEKA